MKMNLETDGISIKLTGVEGLENTQRTYSVSLEMTDSSGVVRYDGYTIVLEDMNSCAVKSSRMQVD
jgi:hypothetical protein